MTATDLLARVDTREKRAAIAREHGAMDETNCAAMAFVRAGSLESARCRILATLTQCDRKGAMHAYYTSVLRILEGVSA